MAMDREEVSERVLEIAEALIEQGGSQNLKARTIAEQAGIAVGSVYNLFRDLDELHGAVNMRLLDRLGAAGAAAMAGLARQGIIDTRLRLLALARAYMDFVDAHRGSWPALLAFNRSTTVRTSSQAYETRLATLLDIIAGVLADGGFYADKHRRNVAARALWSSVHGIVTSGIVSRDGGKQAEEIWEQIDLLVSTFIKGLPRPVT